jgi:hypothetical protein
VVPSIIILPQAVTAVEMEVYIRQLSDSPSWSLPSEHWMPQDLLPSRVSFMAWHMAHPMQEQEQQPPPCIPYASHNSWSSGCTPVERSQRATRPSRADTAHWTTSLSRTCLASSLHRHKHRHKQLTEWHVKAYYVLITPKVNA